MGAHGPHVDQGGGLHEDRVVQHAAVADADVFSLDPGRLQIAPDRFFELGRRGQGSPDVCLDAHDIAGAEHFFPGARGVLFSEQSFDGLVQHGFYGFSAGGTVLLQHVLVADQDHPGLRRSLGGQFFRPGQRQRSGRQRGRSPFDECPAADGLFFHLVLPVVPLFFKRGDLPPQGGKKPKRRGGATGMPDGGNHPLFQNDGEIVVVIQPDRRSRR